MDNDDRLVLSPGDLFSRDGVTYRYLGNGMAEPVETMTKRFDMVDARPFGAGYEPA
jgi:hypothetical protein